ncbi:MAG: sugar phosphate nucleotidyltransferase [archaeon]|nr:sugar phosphate nucleotidyltransferase [archaeon]
MINLIPMAGLGTRFSETGYRLSKPLIPVSGMPMILKVIKDLPKADKWIFVMRKEHIAQGVDLLIKKELPNAIFLVDTSPTGQAGSCMVAKPYINNDDELFIAACDNGFLYDNQKFNILKKRPDVDCIIWTFTKRDVLKKNPHSWGWYQLEEDNETIKEISVKSPISDNPYNDHAVVATFYFKKGKDFVTAIESMIKENYKINNEFYVDAVPKFLKKMNKKSIIFDVDLYVGWGKPEDLHDYEKIEFMIKYGTPPSNISEEEERLIPLWRRYFSK